MSEYIAKASIEPRDYRVVFLIQQKSHSMLVSPHTMALISSRRITFYSLCMEKLSI